MTAGASCMPESPFTRREIVMRWTMRRPRHAAGSAVLLSAAIMLSTATAALAGCGWPNCDPAQLSSTYSQTISPSGVAGTIRVHQQSSVDYPAAEVWTKFTGSSYAKWLGSTPTNASQITLTDQLHTDGIAVSISLPPGFTGGGTDAYYTNSVSSTRTLTHSFWNIHFSCWICYGVRHTATATFKFGNKFFTIQTHDDAFV